MLAAGTLISGDNGVSIRLPAGALSAVGTTIKSEDGGVYVHTYSSTSDLSIGAGSSVNGALSVRIGSRGTLTLGTAGGLQDRSSFDSSSGPVVLRGQYGVTIVNAEVSGTSVSVGSSRGDINLTDAQITSTGCDGNISINSSSARLVDHGGSSYVSANKAFFSGHDGLALGSEEASTVSAPNGLRLTSNASTIAAIQVTRLPGSGTVRTTTDRNGISTMRLSGGTFSAEGGKIIEIDGTTLSINALKAVGYAPEISPVTELLLEEADNKGSTRIQRVANVLTPASEHLQQLIVKTTSSVDSASMTLISGRLFINPLVDTTICTDFGDITAKKGTLLALALEDNALRISACGAPGETTLCIAGRTVTLAPAEEAVITRQQPAQDHLTPADGVGRRHVRTTPLGNGLYLTTSEFSIISMICNAPQMKAIAHPESAGERRLSDRLLKTAACIQQVTGAKGAYSARRNQNSRKEPRSGFRAVNYAQ